MAEISETHVKAYKNGNHNYFPNAFWAKMEEDLGPTRGGWIAENPKFPEMQALKSKPVKTDDPAAVSDDLKEKPKKNENKK